VHIFKHLRSEWSEPWTLISAQKQIPNPVGKDFSIFLAFEILVFDHLVIVSNT